MANTKQTPFIVLDRTAAVAGVQDVDGKVGSVTLDSTDALKMGAVLSVNGNLPDDKGNVNMSSEQDVNVLYLGEILHVQSAGNPQGTLPASGGQYARSTYPDVWEQIADGTLAAVSDDVWMAGDFDKFSYGTSDGTDTGTPSTIDSGDYFRVPDVTNRIQNLQFSKLIKDDLNDLTADATGQYYQNIEADATVALHYPVEGLCGTLEVLGNGVGTVANSPQGCTQIYYAANSDNVYTRFYTAATSSTGGMWSDWILQGSVLDYKLTVQSEVDIENDNRALVLKNKTQDGALYIQALNTDNTNRWYLGNGDVGTNTVGFYNYHGGAKVELLDSGSTRVNGNFEVTGAVESRGDFTVGSTTTGANATVYGNLSTTGNVTSANLIAGSASSAGRITGYGGIPFAMVSSNNAASYFYGYDMTDGTKADKWWLGRGADGTGNIGWHSYVAGNGIDLMSDGSVNLILPSSKMYLVGESSQSILTTSAGALLIVPTGSHSNLSTEFTTWIGTGLNYSAIDFHVSDNSATDYDARITAEYSSSTTPSGNAQATINILAAHVQANGKEIATTTTVEEALAERDAMWMERMATLEARLALLEGTTIPVENDS